MGKPFFRKQTQSWYYKDGNRFVPLGKDKAEAEADTEWHRRMASKARVTPDTTVAVILDKFLTWCGKRRESTTRDWYANYLDDFRDFRPDDHAENFGALALSAIKPHHVSEWIDARYGNLSSNSQFGAARSIVRAMTWAVKEGYIDRNPIHGIDKARPESRVVYITPDQWELIVEAYREDDPFRDFLTILRETGCRPQEARLVQAVYFDRAGEQWVFPVKLSKGKRESRVVPLNSRALEITRRLALKHPTGPIFRNRDGKPWTRHAINCRFKRLSKQLGFEVFAYAIRHTFVTDALTRGCDPVSVATICGHRDATMILKVYQHLHLNKGHIRKALALATGETKGPQAAATTA